MFDPITAAHSTLSHPSLWARDASFKLHFPARIPSAGIYLPIVPAGRLIIHLLYLEYLTCPKVCNVPEQGEGTCSRIGALGVN